MKGADLRTETIAIESRDGQIIHLYRYYRQIDYKIPVVLTHGACSNRDVCAMMARYLVKNNFDVWVYEWRGHGESPACAREPSFDDIALNDVKVTVETVLKKTGRSQVFWVSHSGGGLLPLMYYARNPSEAGQIAAGATLSTNPSECVTDLATRLRIHAIMLYSRILGHFPGVQLKVGPETEYNRLMLQWFKWQLKHRWVSADGFNYAEGCNRLKFPFLVMTGGSDWVAPYEAGARLLEVMGTSAAEKQHIHCSVENGFREDYSHASLFTGRNAHREIYPFVVEWLQKQALK